MASVTVMSEGEKWTALDLERLGDNDVGMWWWMSFARRLQPTE